MIYDEPDSERDECDRCGGSLLGQWMTHYGERLCDTCYDAVASETTSAIEG